MRPIDADAFDRRLAAGEFSAALLEASENDAPFEHRAMYYSTQSFRDVMKCQPTLAHLRPVVTCAHCANRVESLAGGTVIRCATGRYHKPDWFCAGGRLDDESSAQSGG